MKNHTYRVSIMLTLILVCSIGVLANDRTKEHTVQSQFPKEERKFTVTVPEDYDQSKVYPVMFLLDAQSNLGFTKATADYLAGIGEAPPMLIVGIPAGANRARDYVPTAFGGPPQNPTNAKDLLLHIEKEVIPLVEKSYRPAPFRILSGHSLGGIFVLFAMNERRDLFNGYITQSPNLTARFTKILDPLKEKAGTKQSKRFLYANLGNEPRLAKAFTTLEEIGKSAESITATFKVDKSLTHMSTRMLGQYEGIVSIFGKRWKGSEAESIAQKGVRLKNEYGYTVQFDESDWVAAVQGQIRKDPKLGVVAARDFVQAFPTSLVAKLFLSVAYRQAGDMKASREIALKAISKIENGSSTDREKRLLPTLKQLVAEPKKTGN